MASALSTLSRAEALLERGRTAAALPLLRRAEAGAPDRFLKAEIAWRRAEALRSLGRFKEALEAYWLSHKLYRLSGVSSERLRALLGASACLRILGRYKQARATWAAAARQKFFNAPDPSPEDVQMEIALVERGLGLHAAARRRLGACIRGLARKRDVEALQHAWWALAGTERFSGRYPAALRAFRKAEHFARRLNDPSALAYALCGQGGALRILGKGGASFAAYQKASVLFKRAEDPFGRAYGFCGMANALRTYGDARRTIPLYNRSAALYTRVGDRGSRAFAFWGLGGSHRRLGNLDLSRRHYRRALADFRSEGDRRGVVMALLGLGRLEGSPALLRRAAAEAARGKMPYEAALARMELSRLGRPGRPAFHFPGVPARAALSWKDIP